MNIPSLMLPSVLIFGLAIFATYNQSLPPKSIYWGAWISGDTYDKESNPPWNTMAIDIFEENAGKKLSILHWGQSWWHCNGSCDYQLFNLQVAQYDAVRQRGAIPLIDWGSYDFAAPDVLNQSEFSLSTIIAGQHDEYVRQWATQAKAWGHPLFLRFNWEMNGDWFPWSERANGNHAGEYVQAWRHVHDIFKEVGAHNVTWVWCPNVIGPGTIPLKSLYPGDDYVDWVCMDGYNTGRHPTRSGRWQTFDELFSETYSALQVLAPNKPIMIAETASTEVGGSKAEWIRNALLHALPERFPKVEAVIWFNWNIRGIDWAIESSASARRAFAEGIDSRYYAKNRFSGLDTSPIPPADQVPILVPWHDFFLKNEW
jgi:hypothetical protein